MACDICGRHHSRTRRAMRAWWIDHWQRGNLREIMRTAVWQAELTWAALGLLLLIFGLMLPG